MENKFIITGTIRPNEYDWETQFFNIIKNADKNCDIYVNINIGKLAGLCNYIQELEHQLMLLKNNQI